MYFSIIIPVYNSESFIKKTLDSLINQIYKGFEIVLVNDGSTDNTEQVILDYIEEHKEIAILYKRIDNSGPGRARNVGLELTSGDYVCFLDSDDEYDIHLFDELNNYVVDQCDICYFGWIERDETGKTLFVYDKVFNYIDNLSGEEAAENKFYKRLWLCNCNEIYRTKFLKDNGIKYIEKVFSGEDTNFIYKALLSANNVRCLPKNYFINNYRSNSLMHHAFSERYLTEFTALENLLTYCKDKVSNAKYYNMVYTLYYYSRIAVAKKIVKSVGLFSFFKFKSMVSHYIPKIKKTKSLLLTKKERIEDRIFRFSKCLFLLVVKTYYKLKAKN